MDSDLFSGRRAERFAQLLDEANGGRRHHVRSRADGELTALVAVGRRLTVERPTVEVDSEFRTSLRAMLVATAEREGVTAGAGATAGLRGALLPAITGRRARARGAILVGVAAGAIALSGISAASENALPGDALYGMKRSTERAQLALAKSDISRGQLFLDFARTRLDEAASVRDDRLGFSAVLDDMDADTRQGVRLLTTVAAQRSDPTALDAVDTFLAGQRRMVSGLLDRPDHADRDRTRRSLALLDAAGRRADALREAIACGLPAPSVADTLGPAPTICPGER
ncbi:DUF5667 domain-containing protein [Micromonospora sp. WMMD1128]|uniref:DUF5667 domain-containing protein n=1 Tax=unclassified Micromonospora TaxID=2617518 RepID=UPI00248C110F|nr:MULTISPECIES: DUF5667 domain-containing protein [unclassified Micromonospora]WBB74293.1 DUF5667 domain-containing protein [Micromonospora sp. WMMD1128]WFE32322.1 DUF5667 domain-containing protein [Micromonospora sp. WMMD975]